jgi:hypothetical protein
LLEIQTGEGRCARAGAQSKDARFDTSHVKADPLQAFARAKTQLVNPVLLNSYAQSPFPAFSITSFICLYYSQSRRIFA